MALKVSFSLAVLCNIPSRTLTWNLRIDRWKTIFLYNPVVLGFRVNLHGSIIYGTHMDKQSINHSC